MPAINASNSGFANLVTRELRFLVERGFALVDATPHIVNYQTDEVIVLVIHDPLSSEVSCDFIFDNQTFPLNNMMRMAHADDTSAYHDWMASNPKDLEPGIVKLAEDIKQHCQAALAGDALYFTKLARFQEDWSNQHQLELRAAENRPKAHAAFHNKKYHSAIRAFGTYAPLLTEAEQKMLEFAREHARAINPKRAS